MRKICISFLVLFIIFLTIGCGNTAVTNGTEYLRIHVRANSNSSCDQAVKYEIKDAIVNVLTPLVADCHTKSETEKVIKANKVRLEKIIDGILLSKGFTYSSHVKITNEKFPTRVYEDLTLESGYYDAVIVELGKAEGDNWWCVVYPPLCFGNSENVVYKSKIAEIIDEFKRRK